MYSSSKNFKGKCLSDQKINIWKDVIGHRKVSGCRNGFNIYQHKYITQKFYRLITIIVFKLFVYSADC